MLAFIKWAVLAPAIVYFSLLGLVYVFQRNLMYLPGHVGMSPADVYVPEMKVLSVQTVDGLDIEIWHGEASLGQPTIVLFHGNAGTLADRAFKARFFMDAGYGVILAGYRGFGKNKGSPDEEGLYKDARAVFSYLAQFRGSIILYGESLGSGVAVQMADEITRINDHPLQNRLSGVILEAPFTSMSDAAAYHYPWLPARILVWDRFDSISKIQNIGAPLLIVHGQQDKTVPVQQGERLLQAALEPKKGVWLSEAGHVDIYDHGAKDHILGWINEQAINR